MCFSPYLGTGRAGGGGGGVLPRDWYARILLMQFFSLYSSKIKDSTPFFFIL